MKLAIFRKYKPALIRKRWISPAKDASTCISIREISEEAIIEAEGMREERDCLAVYLCRIEDYIEELEAEAIMEECQAMVDFNQAILL